MLGEAWRYCHRFNTSGRYIQERCDCHILCVFDDVFKFKELQ